MPQTSSFLVTTLVVCSALSSSAFTAPTRPLSVTSHYKPSAAVSTTHMFMSVETDEQENKTEETMSSSMGVFVPPGKTQHENNQYGVPEGDIMSAVETNDQDDNKKELSETQKLMQQVKDSGLAGVISYALWELGFWTLSVPVCILGYQKVTGHWPNLQNSDDLQKLGAEAFAFVNFARFAVPLRIGLALSTTPWIQQNLVDRFNMDKKDQEEE